MKIESKVPSRASRGKNKKSGLSPATQLPVAALGDNEEVCRATLVLQAGERMKGEGTSWVPTRQVSMVLWDVSERTSFAVLLADSLAKNIPRSNEEFLELLETLDVDPEWFDVIADVVNRKPGPRPGSSHHKTALRLVEWGNPLHGVEPDESFYPEHFAKAAKKLGENRNKAQLRNLERFYRRHKKIPESEPPIVPRIKKFSRKT